MTGVRNWTTDHCTEDQFALVANLRSGICFSGERDRKKRGVGNTPGYKRKEEGRIAGKLAERTDRSLTRRRRGRTTLKSPAREARREARPGG